MSPRPWRIKQIERTCETCGVLFMAQRCRVLKGHARFCSRSCLAKAKLPSIEGPRLKAIIGKMAHNNRQVTLTCRQCQTEFKISPSKVEGTKFCSLKCYGIAQRAYNTSEYKRVYVNGKRVTEHRHVMEQEIGRKLSSREHVDHKNRIRDDNAPLNLRVLDPSAHGRISSSQRGVPVGQESKLCRF